MIDVANVGFPLSPSYNHPENSPRTETEDRAQNYRICR